MRQEIYLQELSFWQALVERDKARFARGRGRRRGCLHSVHLVVEYNLVWVRWRCIASRRLILVLDDNLIRVRSLCRGRGRGLVHDTRLETAVQVGGEPPCGAQSVEETRERGRAKRAALDILAEVGFAAEEPAQVAVVLDALRPVVGEEDGR